MPACSWEIIDCCDCSAYVNLSEAVQAEVQEWAIDRLWKWTRERFGVCDVVVHPQSQGVCCSLEWVSLPVGMYRCRQNEILLPAPVHEIVEIVIEDEVQDLDDFHVEDYKWLVRDVGGRFPSTDWEVTYGKGEPVPPGGGIVAGVLACEYAKRLCNDDSCRLPKRLTVANRQGLTVATLDNYENMKEGGTGMWEIDDWIMEQNKPVRSSAVSSPDIVTLRTTTWTNVGVGS